MSEEDRKEEVSLLSSSLEKQTTLFKKALPPSVGASNTRASYRVAHLVARSLKPFADGEFIKECMMAAVEDVCPEKKGVFSQISLSASTITRRVEEMASDVRSSLRERCQGVRYFSLALDEFTDVKDTAQLAIFFRGVTDNLDVVEEFLQLVPLKGTTTGDDVLCAVLMCGRNGIGLSPIVRSDHRRFPSHGWLNEGISFAPDEALPGLDLGHQQDIVRFHCIVHQEALCAKSATLSDVMSVVVKAANFVLARGLNHRQFRDLLADAKTEYGDLVYFCDVRWLSRGSIIKRVFDLRKQLSEFLSSKGAEFLQFEDAVWVADLAFLADLTTHLNNLNLQLQGRDILVTDMISKVHAFEMKLKLLESQLEKKDFTHFSKLASVKPTSTEKYVDVVRDLRKEFASRVADVCGYTPELKLFSAPFDADPECAPADLQLELIELQCSDELRSKFNGSSPSPSGSLKFAHVNYRPWYRTR